MVYCWFINVTEKTPRSSGQDPFGVLWRLIWCSRAGCTALGRFFRVGRSCSVADFPGFPRVVQCAGQAFCVEMLASQKRTLRGSPVTPPGIDPGTVRLVAQRLNHYSSSSIFYL